MYLKKIEINGFKSFANKIVFEFPHGITGIVGPNGSGKSNIGDAVRWVLGEQSAKQLRGSKMEDVIFSGTENRKPMGFAYVAIVFDNHDRRIALDYEEVKVARRVYRSGESEYMINGSPCRRRDIVEIFYDTGIGKEGYSIIGQGQVEKILSGKIEDSRELFDEAAGIAKFKKNRSVTEKTLEQERANLERVTDILSELEKQVGPLEKQSKKAKEFLKLRDREKELDIGLFIHDYEESSMKKQEAEQELSIIQSDLNRTQVDYGIKKSKNQSIQNQLEELKQQEADENALKEDTSAVLSEIESGITGLKHAIDKNKLSIGHYKETIERIGLEKKEKESQLVQIAETLKEQHNVQEKEEANLKKLNVELEQLSEQKAQLEGKLSAKQDSVFDYLSANTDLKEKLSRYETMEEQLGIRNAEYNSRLLVLNQECAEYTNRYIALEKELELTHIKWEKSQKDYDVFAGETESKKHTIRDLKSSYDKERQELLRHGSRYDTLISIHERYEGYQKSIQYVMEQKKRHKGIIGVVADIISLEQRYETAIEIALGGALQNIVTEDEAVAKEMVSYLKKNRLGRATFLPLSAVRKRYNTISDDILTDEGVIGRASTLVSTDSRYSDLIESLLGRTVVVDSMDHALVLARKNRYSLRIVTLDGELLNPGGSITGGAFKNAGNLLGRQREIDEIKEKLNCSKEQVHAIKNELERLESELEQDDIKLSEDKEHLDQLILALHDYNKQLPELELKKQDIQDKISELKKDHIAIQAQLDEIKHDKEALTMTHRDDEAFNKKNAEIIEELESKIALISDSHLKKDNEKNECAIVLERISQQILFSESEQKRLENEICDGDMLAETNTHQIKMLEEENALSDKELLRQEERRRNVQEEIDSINLKLGSLAARQEELIKKQNRSFEELSELNEQLRILDKKESSLSNRLERAALTLSNLVDYMWENYEITYNYTKTLQKESYSDEEIRSFRNEKKDITQQIRKLGNVNVNAIEEYKEVGERYTFLKQQYDDIKESEEKLVGMIDDLNLAMRKRFSESFALIRETFSTVFKDLFEGGTADLELMDESNLLECGIRIVAQPPGKKLQNILLLSGGEKALTAIALLFAIQNLKPSPFCLLDEIEAALDDVNIIRFSKYLKKLSKETQFIVITHRRGTMTASDSLYGITMQEKGISTLISVDLINKQLEE